MALNLNDVASITKENAMVHYSEIMSQHERRIKNLEMNNRLMDASREVAAMVKDFTVETVGYVYGGKDISMPEVELGLRKIIDQCSSFFYDSGYLKKSRGYNICSINIDRPNKTVMVSITPRCAKRAFTFSMSL